MDETESGTTPPRVAGIPALHLDGFDGPMDVLLDLAERQRVDLGGMSVLDLAEQFVVALAQLGDRVPIERRADWVVMASRLLLLRSRLLFPASPEAAAEAERDAAAELHRLDEMVRMRVAGAWLLTRPQLGIERFAPPAAPLRRGGGYVALMEACLAVLRGKAGRPEDAAFYRLVVEEFWRVQDALLRIRAMLATDPDGGELAAFLPPDLAHGGDPALPVRAAVASTLVAGLELARDGALTLTQSSPFGAVRFKGIAANTQTGSSS